MQIKKKQQHIQAFGRQMPNDVDLEGVVLGAIILEKDAISEVVDILSADDFYSEENKLIYRSVARMFNKGKKIDLQLLAGQLKEDGVFEKVGEVPYLAQLTHNVASAAHIEAHARSVLERSMRRQAIRLADTMAEDAHCLKTDLFDFLDKTEQKIFDITDRAIRKNGKNVNALMQGAIKRLEMRKKNKNGITGIPSGFHLLDRFTNGWQPSDFVVVAARPGMGKTSFLLSILRNAAVDHKCAVAFFSLEMSVDQLMDRIISQEAGIDNEKIKRGDLSEKEWKLIFERTAKLSEAKMHIDDTPALSLFELRAKCRRLKAKQDVQMVIVDYLQLMAEDQKRSSFHQNREQQIATISRGLKAIAKELNIVVIAASQLSRAVEIRGGDKRPQLSDLRESGAIEQDVDMAMFLYRPEYYGISECDSDGGSTEGLAEVIIAKHRNGPTGKIKVNFNSKLTKFTNRTPQTNDFIGPETPF